MACHERDAGLTEHRKSETGRSWAAAGDSEQVFRQIERSVILQIWAGDLNANRQPIGSQPNWDNRCGQVAGARRRHPGD